MRAYLNSSAMGWSPRREWGPFSASRRDSISSHCLSSSDSQDLQGGTQDCPTGASTSKGKHTVLPGRGLHAGCQGNAVIGSSSYTDHARAPLRPGESAPARGRVGSGRARALRSGCRPGGGRPGGCAVPGGEGPGVRGAWPGGGHGSPGAPGKLPSAKRLLAPTCGLFSPVPRLPKRRDGLGGVGGTPGDPGWGWGC